MHKPRRRLTKAQASKNLLKTLTDNPALPAFVRTLKAPVLKRLIDHVGLHDAGDLIALTSTEQLREIFEVSLWESLAPGQAERLQPEKFLEWLDVMLEVGPTFAAQRLIELGDTFVTLNFAPLIKVTDSSVMAEHQEDAAPCGCALCQLTQRDASFDIIADYLVMAVHDDEWDAVRATLVELESEDAQFLHRVLARCCNRATVRFLVAEDPEPLLDDETYEREQRRERSGFVTPQIAATFLATTRKTPSAELIARNEYDDISRRYFEQLAAAAKADAEPEKTDEQEDDDSPEAAVAPVELRALEEALVQAEIVGDASPKLLTGPKASREPVLELQAHLDRLQITRPDVFVARLGELIFLANVLMAGSWYQGGRFTEAEAARAALACANLGLDFVLNEERAMSSARRAQFIEMTLEDAPGIVRLFQVGWNLLQALPMRSAVSLIEALRSDHVRAQLKHKRWMLDEIEIAVNDPDIFDLIEQGEFADVADNLVLLSLVLDARACHCLRTLIADLPRFPQQLNLGFERAQASTNESQYVSTVQQLNKVDGFLQRLDRLLKV
jgi:hypothetical protein